MATMSPIARASLSSRPGSASPVDAPPVNAPSPDAGADEKKKTERAVISRFSMTFEDKDTEEEFLDDHFAASSRLARIYAGLAILVGLAELVAISKTWYVTRVAPPLDVLAGLFLLWCSSTVDGRKFLRKHPSRVTAGVAFVVFQLHIMFNAYEGLLRDPDNWDGAEARTLPRLMVYAALAVAPFVPFLYHLQVVGFMVFMVVQFNVLLITRASAFDLSIGSDIAPWVVFDCVITVAFAVVSFDRHKSRRENFFLLRSLRKAGLSVEFVQHSPDMGQMFRLFAGRKVGNRGLPQAAWLVDPSEIEWGPSLGRGAFGEVFRCEFRGSPVAVKSIVSNVTDSNVREEFFSEVAHLSELRHPNIVLLMGVAVTPDKLLIITELMERGSLARLIHSQEEGQPGLNINLIVSVARQVASGLRYLHVSGHLHRDLKPHNILLDTRLVAKLADFGLSTTLQPLPAAADQYDFDSGGASTMDPGIKNAVNADPDLGSATTEFSRLNGQLGTINYLAPEVLIGKPYTQPSDIYSFGVILWEMFAAEVPFEDILDGGSPFQLLFVVGQLGRRPVVPVETPSGMLRLIESCWNQAPARRPFAAEITKALDKLADELDVSADVSLTSMVESRPAALSPFANPSHAVTVLAIDVHNRLVLWGKQPGLMRESVEVLVGITKKLAEQRNLYKAHLVRSEGGLFGIAFATPLEAVAYMRLLLMECSTAAWPWIPLRLKAVFHSGNPQWIPNERGPAIAIGPDIELPLQLVPNVGPKQGFATDAFVEAFRASPSSNVSPLEFIEDHSVFQSAGAGNGDGTTSGAGSTGGGGDGESSSGDPSAPVQILAGGEVAVAKMYRIVGNGFVEPREPGPSGAGSAHASAAAGLPPGVADEMELTSFASGRARSKEQFVIKLVDLELTQKIGVGSFAEVFDGTWKGQRVAVKKLLHVNDRHSIGLFEEASLQRSLQHPNVVSVLGFCPDIRQPMMVMEYMQMSLRQMLDERSFKLPEVERIRILHEAAKGVAYIHSKNLIHRDLKSANLLLHEGAVKIADFGLARLRSNTVTMTQCGSVSFSSPEIIKGKRYAEPADVYSFAIVTWEVVSRNRPYIGRPVTSIAWAVTHGVRPAIPDNCNAILRDIMTRGWAQEADERPTIGEVVGLLEKAREQK